MVLAILMLFLAVGQAGPPAKVALTRQYKLGEKAQYEFASRVNADVREEGLETFLPERAEFLYGFSLETAALKPDGVADIRMRRPKIVIRLGEDFNSAPKDVVVAKDQVVLFTLSNKSQVLSIRDESPKKPAKKPGGLKAYGRGSSEPLQINPEAWIQQMRSFSAFANFFDLGPILPNEPVAIGDTWLDTVGYAPITVQTGADKGKSIIKRLDFVYTFKGKADLNGKPVLHIQGKVTQDTDAAPYIAEALGVKMDRAPFKSFKLTMSGVVDYYLALNNLATLKVDAVSEGSVEVTELGADYVAYEERFKSRATLTKK